MKPVTPFRRLVLCFGLLAFILCFSAGRAARAQDIHVLRPVEGAIVRETVPVKIAPGDLPDNGYVGITIDGQFQTARVLPDDKNAPVFDWDTKAPYTTPDDTVTPKYVADGKHTIKVEVYDKGGALKGTATINIQVANKITTAAMGITLAYRWTKDLQLRYSRVFELDTVGSDASATGGASTGAAGENLQAASVKFTRSVEDISGGNYLVRDRILPDASYLGSKGQSQRIDALYNLKSKYRTVDAQGRVLSEMAPFTTGQHVAFSIPVLADRRVAVGDSWQAPVQLALEWAALEPTKITAESRLEGFEWQNGYPCAKIREKYSGPVTYKLLGGTSVDITN
ncbi:MAG: hypothetical protein M3Y28_05160, partial [Armatimonadota bacterium]|nr:hypothetical protein [Armatimonadota bacterium]